VIQIRWLDKSEVAASEPPEPPRQIPCHKPQMPADLTEGDWSVMLEVLELVKRTIPTNSDSAPEEVFGVIRRALLAHFAETEPCS
jgi:hypothetical protein